MPTWALPYLQDGAVLVVSHGGAATVVLHMRRTEVPCDIMKRILPRAWSTDPFFRQIDEPRPRAEAMVLPRSPSAVGQFLPTN